MKPSEIISEIERFSNVKLSDISKAILLIFIILVGVLILSKELFENSPKVSELVIHS
jgi:hypothetical protein